VGVPPGRPPRLRLSEGVGASLQGDGTAPPVPRPAPILRPQLRLAGLSEMDGMRWMGHATPSIFRRYASVSNDADLHASARRVQAFLGKTSPKGQRGRVIALPGR
jgi:hypothetical protein